MQNLIIKLLLKIMREIALIVAGFVLLIIMYDVTYRLPLKYNPFYYINNVLFMEAVPENPLLVRNIFGKIGIKYREDVVDNGVIYCGDFRPDDKFEKKEIVQLTKIIDIGTFKKININDSSSVSTYYKDKKFYYEVTNMSDGIHLYIYESEPR